MLKDFDISADNILLSGGAAGSDAEFSKHAQKAKHKIVHWTFKDHKTKLRSNLYQLTPEHLATSDDYLIRANKGLVRTFPSNSDYTNNLLRRNYYQVKWCESVYAVSKFASDSSMLKIDGGTAWACQMYVDRFIYDQEPFSLCNLYLFDQSSEKWFQWNRIWKAIDKPPMPKGVYAGIGTRNISDAGTIAIKSLYT